MTMVWHFEKNTRKIGQYATLYDDHHRLKEELSVVRTTRNEVCQHGHVIPKGALAVRHYSWNPCWQKWYCLNHETLAIQVSKS